MSEIHAASVDAVMITINVPPALEEWMIDWLLERDSPAFTSYDVNGHSARHGHLSVKEQVSGRQRRLQFEVQLDAAALETFRADLVKTFAGSDVYYRATPVITAGHLGREAERAGEPQRGDAAGAPGTV
jgi:Protein of unknown function (DUF3240)